MKAPIKQEINKRSKGRKKGTIEKKTDECN
jgi:hypothetical protein